MNIKLAKNLLTVAGTFAILNSSIAYGDEIKVIDKQFYVNKVQNTQAGYNYLLRQEKQENGKTLIISNYDTEHKFNRNGFEIKVIQSLKFIETEAGKPVSFESRVESMGENILIKGVFITPKKVSVTTILNDDKSTKEHELTQNILLPYAIEQLYKNNSDRDVLRYATIDLSNDFKVINVTAKKLGIENIKYASLKEDCNKYQVSVDILSNLKNIEWRNSQGKLVKEHSSILNLEQIAVNENEILGNFDSFDILSESWLPVDTKIKTPFNLKEACYKIKVKNSSSLNSMINDERQRIIQKQDNTIYLKVNIEDIRKEYNYPVKIQGMLDYLKPGPFITSDNAEILKVAREITAHKRDANIISRDMEQWVYQHIKQKDLSVNFADANTVLKTQKGDCTEHSILLASLLRAVDIPSKLVVGLIYNDSVDNAFVYHMWVKAYLGDGVWINLDPSFPKKEFSPVHIALKESAINNLNDRTNLLIGIMNEFSNLEIEVLDYKVIKENQFQLKVTKEAEQSETSSLIDVKNNNVKTIEKISLKGNPDSNKPEKIELKEKNVDDCYRKALYEYSIGNINTARNNFIKTSNKITFNNDLANIQLIKKLVSIGLFNLANDEFRHTYDNEIWNIQIKDIKNIYFPAYIPSPKQESILAKAQSEIDYQFSPNSAIDLIIDNMQNLQSCDYALFLLAKAYCENNQLNEALGYIKKAVEVHPNNLNYRLQLAKIYSKQNNFSKALIEIENILSYECYDKEFLKLVKIEENWLKFKIYRKQKSKSYYHLAKYYAIKGDFKTAKKNVSNSIKYYSKNADTYLLLGDINYNSNKFDSAMYAYKKAVKYNRNSDKVYVAIGNIHMLKGEFNKALNYYKKAEKYNPKSLDALNAIAKIYKELAQDNVAIEYYSKALEVDSMNYTANFNLGNIYINNNSDNSVKYLKKAVSIRPLKSEAWISLTESQINENNYFLAKTYIKPVNVIDYEDASYFYYMGLIDKDSENYASARNNFRKAIKLKPNYSEAVKELNLLNEL